MKQLDNFIQEKLKLDKNLKNKSDYQEYIEKIISDYILKEYNYELDNDYNIVLSDDSDLLIDFKEELKLSEKKLNDIGEEISKILKKNWITPRSAPMLSSSEHNKNNHQIKIYLW